VALAAVQKVIYKLLDSAGKIGTMSFTVPTSGGSDPITTLASIVPLINAISDAIVTGQIGQTSDNGTVGTSAFAAYDIRDKLAVEYVGSQNDHHFLMVPDPNPAIFLAGKEIPDPTNASWIALQTAIVGNVKDKLGNAVTIVRAFRQRSRNLKTSLKFQ
jgi:hypothetical protein